MEEHENNDFSIEVQDVLGKPPKALVRWGTWLLSGVVAAILLGMWLFQYPIIISAPVVLFSQNPPVSVVGRASGAIDTILVENGKNVHQGECVAVIRSAANVNDMFSLIHFSHNTNNLFADTIVNQLPKAHLNLGDLQDYYSVFRYNLLRFYQQSPHLYFAQKDTLVKSRTQILFDELNYLHNKLKLKNEELSFEQKQIKRDSSLHKQGVISLQKYENSLQAWLKAQSELKNLQQDETELRAQIASLRESSLDLNFRQYERNEEIEKQLVASYHALKKQLAIWKDKHLLVAPTDGKLVFNKFWYTNQYVKADENVFSVVPQGEQKIRGRVKLAPNKSGLVKSGQQVRIKLDNFPYLEFGVVNATVNWVSEIPEDGYYLAEVEITPPFGTNYKRNIPFQQELMGTAEIITERRRFLVHLLSPLRWFFSNDSQ